MPKIIIAIPPSRVHYSRSYNYILLSNYLLLYSPTLTHTHTHTHPRPTHNPHTHTAMLVGPGRHPLLLPMCYTRRGLHYRLLFSTCERQDQLLNPMNISWNSYESYKKHSKSIAESRLAARKRLANCLSVTRLSGSVIDRMTLLNMNIIIDSVVKFCYEIQLL